jgi:cysteinyl-tRNA synthetase
MANVWMHGGLLIFDGKKMSKSLGNFEPLSALLDRHDPQAIRLLFLEAGYRKPLNFTEESIAGKTTALRRLLGAYDTLRTAPAVAHDEAGARAAVEPYIERFYAALDDDVNTSGAVSVLFDVANASAELQARGAASRAAAFVHEGLTILGLSPAERKPVVEAAVVETVVLGSDAADGYSVTAPADAHEVLTDDLLERLRALAGPGVAFNGHSGVDVVNAVIVARYRAKVAKNFAEADRLREALKAVGIVLTDSKKGAAWSVGA